MEIIMNVPFSGSPEILRDAIGETKADVAIYAEGDDALTPTAQLKEFAKVNKTDDPLKFTITGVKAGKGKLVVALIYERMTLDAMQNKMVKEEEKIIWRADVVIKDLVNEN